MCTPIRLELERITSHHNFTLRVTELHADILSSDDTYVSHTPTHVVTSTVDLEAYLARTCTTTASTNLCVG